MLRQSGACGGWHPVAADAAALPFRDGSFDLVLAAFCLNHLASLAAGLAEVRRVGAADRRQHVRAGLDASGQGRGRMRPSARSATARRPGTRPCARVTGQRPAGARRGARPRPGSPACGCAPWPSRPGSRPPPNWCPGGWAWPTSPRSCARWTRPAGPRCGARPSGPWPPCRRRRRWSSRWCVLTRVLTRGPAAGPPPAAARPHGCPRPAPAGRRGPRPGPARRAGEVGGHVAGPPPRLDGHAAVQQVQVRGHRVGVHGQAERVVRPVRAAAGRRWCTGARPAPPRGPPGRWPRRARAPRRRAAAPAGR